MTVIEQELELLRRLAVGAHTAVDSVRDWKARLGDGKVDADFLYQLGREWFPAQPPDPDCAELAENVRAHMASWHTGWPNLWSHTQRAAGYALRIASDAKVAPRLAYMMVTLHDIGKFDEMRDGTPHEETAVTMAQSLLGNYCTPSEIASICGAIGKTSANSSPFVKVLNDADKLDKIGASGIVRRVSQVVTLDNAFVAVRRVEGDLERFPMMKLPTAQGISEGKRAFTQTFLNPIRPRLSTPI